MEIVSMKAVDKNAAELFSLHDDHMIGFLGEDSIYYTRYSDNENLENIWVLFIDGISAGCIAYRRRSDDTGEVKRLFIKKEYRGKGLSKRLLEAVENYAREQGCIKLFLDTRITLEPAVSVYHSFGFEIVFRQDLYIQMEKMIW